MITSPDAETRKVAAEVAAHIREHGHYQDTGDDEGDGAYTPTSPGRPCCLLYNPTLRGWDTSRDLRPAELLAAAFGRGYSYQLIELNDTTPTDELLARLDAIAEGTAA